MVAELENGTRCVHENVSNRYDEFSASTIQLRNNNDHFDRLDMELKKVEIYIEVIHIFKQTA